jgi:hypothetical protein
LEFAAASGLMAFDSVWQLLSHHQNPSMQLQTFHLARAIDLWSKSEAGLTLLKINGC